MAYDMITLIFLRIHRLMMVCVRWLYDRSSSKFVHHQLTWIEAWVHHFCNTLEKLEVLTLIKHLKLLLREFVFFFFRNLVVYKKYQHTSSCCDYFKHNISNLVMSNFNIRKFKQKNHPIIKICLIQIFCFKSNTV